MILVVAGNYSEFKTWLKDNVRYAARPEQLRQVNPANCEVKLVGQYTQSILYDSDELFDLLVATEQFKKLPNKKITRWTLFKDFLKGKK